MTRPNQKAKTAPKGNRPPAAPVRSEGPTLAALWAAFDAEMAALESASAKKAARFAKLNSAKESRECGGDVFVEQTTPYPMATTFEDCEFIIKTRSSEIGKDAPHDIEDLKCGAEDCCVLARDAIKNGNAERAAFFAFKSAMALGLSFLREHERAAKGGHRQSINATEQQLKAHGTPEERERKAAEWRDTLDRLKSEYGGRRTIKQLYAAIGSTEKPPKKGAAVKKFLQRNPPKK